MRLEELREKRQEMGLSQFQLAEQIGIDRSSLALIELGTRKPSYDVLCKISKAVNEKIEIGKDRKTICKSKSTN